MDSKSVVKLVGIVALALICLFVINGFFGERKARIEADRAEKLRLIEREEAAIVEAQATERTEERSQFWQKLVPWGDDENEDNTTEIDQ